MTLDQMRTAIICGLMDPDEITLQAGGSLVDVLANAASRARAFAVEAIEDEGTTYETVRVAA